MRISETSSSTSSLVSATASIPLHRTAARAATASNQPVRRGRPVVVPNSLPRRRRCSPVLSLSSVGNGPLPTRVVYALKTPEDAVDRARRHAARGRGEAGEAPGRGHERVGAVVEVQQRALGAFEEDRLALRHASRQDQRTSPSSGARASAASMVRSISSGAGTAAPG